MMLNFLNFLNGSILKVIIRDVMLSEVEAYIISEKILIQNLIDLRISRNFSENKSV